MKVSITYRLFLSILAATCLALLCMFLIMQQSISQGFFQYLNSMEQGRLVQLAGILEQEYAADGGWDALRENRRHFHLMVERARDAAAAQRAQELSEGTGAPALQPPAPRSPRLPFVVIDADRNVVVGTPGDAKESNFIPIVHDGNTVGYVGLMSPLHFLTPSQFKFLTKQRSAMVLAALGMVMVVIIFSIPLAKRMVRPIRAMAAATNELASGNYAVRIPVSSTDELGQLARDFNELALTLEKNEKERRQWVADISHELRTPVAVLRGEIEALLDGIRSVTPETMRSLHAEVLQLNRLIEDLYQLSQSDIGTLSYRKEQLDLAEAVRDSAESYGAEFGRRGIKLTSELPDKGGITVLADGDRLDQLLANLFENSLKYTDKGGELVVRLACREGRAVIDFEDSAPGVPKEDLARLFDRFYRVDASRSRSSGGAGLGLAICRNIVEAHAGAIEALPSSLGGVLIRVTMPVTGECA